ncbi:MAG TPA: hypothetical protein VJ827_11315 [Rubrobacter sp.]|nr:hypothetical protein [Rubrobacter sp.]
MVGDKGEGDWGKSGSESAVVTVTLDGKYNQDVVLFEGEQRFTYQLALGTIKAGRHTVEVASNPEKSPAGATGAQVHNLSTQVVSAKDPAPLAYQYSPILYGRDLPEIPGQYENNYTDVPLIMYHTTSTDSASGNTTIEYTVIWSNEDGGTNTPALMARWGRSTDIEWIYRVTLDPKGNIVSEFYQAPNHETLPFTGAKEGNHPLLQTSTSNNNLTQVTDPALSSDYRFFMDPTQTLPDNRAREVVMDENPWSYQIMAKEMVREGKIEANPKPSTPEVSDQRNYLYIEIDKDTTYPTPPASGNWVGTAVAVKLTGDHRWYTSNHDIPDWSIERDIPAATTVELPPGTTASDIEAIKVFAVPVDSNPNDATPAPSDYRIDFTDINRAFFLDGNYLPGSSFIDWSGDVVLTPQNPETIVWQAR